MNQILARMRKICLGLPDTKETPTWGQPHFRVGEKIFAGCGEEGGRRVIGFKLEREHAEVIVNDPRFWPAPYVGKHGWVSMDAGQIKDWDEVRELVLESYRLIAPKRSLARLEQPEGDGRPAPAARTRRSGAARARATRSSRVRAVLLVLGLAAATRAIAALPAEAETAAPAPAGPSSRLKPFERFVGRTWKALVNQEKGMYDVARWELALGGQAVRIRHSVADGVYGGESFIVWDAERKGLVSYYFTTAGFYTRGTIDVDAAGRIEVRETVIGGGGGPSEVRATFEILPDGRMSVSTTMKRGDAWDPPSERTYVEDPGASIVLP